MKTLNTFRATNKFCITGGFIRQMAEIQTFFAERGESIVAIANDDSTCQFTVRVCSKSGITDHKVEVYGAPRIAESIQITGGARTPAPQSYEVNSAFGQRTGY